jgi:hypothetical protein
MKIQIVRHGHIWPCPGFWKLDDKLCVCDILAKKEKKH